MTKRVGLSHVKCKAIFSLATILLQFFKISACNVSCNISNMQRNIGAEDMRTGRNNKNSIWEMKANSVFSFTASLFCWLSNGDALCAKAAGALSPSTLCSRAKGWQHQHHINMVTWMLHGSLPHVSEPRHSGCRGGERTALIPSLSSQH